MVCLYSIHVVGIVYICTCICIFAYTYVYLNMCIETYVYILSIYMYVYIYPPSHTRVFSPKMLLDGMFIYVDAYVYVYMNGSYVSSIDIYRYVSKYE